MKTKGKSKGIAFLFWILLGFIGGHRFYMDSIFVGLMFLFSFGLVLLTSGAWTFVHLPVLLLDGLFLLIRRF